VDIRSVQFPCMAWKWSGGAALVRDIRCRWSFGRILVPGLHAIHIGTRGWILADGNISFRSVRAVHLWNPGESYMGSAGVVATGILLAFTLRRTGNLWLAVGWHASFDFGETFLYSVPNSGMLFEHHLSSATLHGATWLTGGTVGPEGSVFSFLTMGIVAVAIHLLFPAKKTEPAQT